MPAKRFNKILRQRDGVAYVDVSTKSYPYAVVKIDVDDLPLMFDGLCGWTPIRTKRGSKTLYACRKIGGRKAAKFQLLHRVILGLTLPNEQGDHRNSDGLDNRRKNLRVATNAQNSSNGRSHRDSSSKYRGVSWDAARERWAAGISKGKGLGRKSLGRFTSELAAARAYDRAARERHGAFARLNFPRK